MNDGVSTADILAMTRNNENEMWNNPFIYLVWLAVLGGGLGNGGLFGGGNNSANISNSLNQQDIFRNQANIMQEISAFERDATNNWGEMKYDNLVGVNSLMAATNQNRFDAAKCCCETNRNIDAVRYENSRNTCDVTDAIHREGEATRALINSNTMQELRDRLAQRDRDLMSAELRLSHKDQEAALINELRPCSKPAYITCSPYASYCPPIIPPAAS